MQKGQIVLIFRLPLHKTDHKRRFLFIQPSFLEMILKTFKFYSPNMKLVLLSPSLKFGNNLFLRTTVHIDINICILRITYTLYINESCIILSRFTVFAIRMP